MSRCNTLNGQPLYPTIQTLYMTICLPLNWFSVTPATRYLSLTWSSPANMGNTLAKIPYIIWDLKEKVTLIQLQIQMIQILLITSLFCVNRRKLSLKSIIWDWVIFPYFFEDQVKGMRKEGTWDKIWIIESMKIIDITYQLSNYPTNYLTGTHPKTRIIRISTIQFDQ